MKFISGILGGNKKNGDFFLELKEQPDEPMPKPDAAPVAASNNGAKAATAVDTAKVEETPANEVKETKKKSIKTAKKTKAKAVDAKEKVEEKAAAAPAPVASKVEEEPKETNFATKYLIPKNDNMRRRPGANMNSFLEMAGKVKTPMK